MKCEHVIKAKRGLNKMRDSSMIYIFSSSPRACLKSQRSTPTSKCQQQAHQAWVSAGMATLGPIGGGQELSGGSLDAWST